MAGSFALKRSGSWLLGVGASRRGRTKAVSRSSGARVFSSGDRLVASCAYVAVAVSKGTWSRARQTRRLCKKGGCIKLGWSCNRR